MQTFNQLSKSKKISCRRLSKKRYNRTKHLNGCQQKKKTKKKVQKIQKNQITKPTFNQVKPSKKITCRRIKKKRCNRTKPLNGCPQKKGVCVRVYITKPKKPNSAQRKVAKVALGRTF